MSADRCQPLHINAAASQNCVGDPTVIAAPPSSTMVEENGRHAAGGSIACGRVVFFSCDGVNRGPGVPTGRVTPLHSSNFLVPHRCRATCHTAPSAAHRYGSRNQRWACSPAIHRHEVSYCTCRDQFTLLNWWSGRQCPVPHDMQAARYIGRARRRAFPSHMMHRRSDSSLRRPHSIDETSGHHLISVSALIKLTGGLRPGAL